MKRSTSIAVVIGANFDLLLQTRWYSASAACRARSSSLEGRGALETGAADVAGVAGAADVHSSSERIMRSACACICMLEWRSVLLEQLWG